MKSFTEFTEQPLDEASTQKLAVIGNKWSVAITPGVMGLTLIEVYDNNKTIKLSVNTAELKQIIKTL